jgi:hypothetical protein
MIMSTCCPEFRADLLAARAAVRRITLQSFEGFATSAEVDAANARLEALEGAPDLLAVPPPVRAYRLELRFRAFCRAARKAA